jgi:hypothetical protein
MLAAATKAKPPAAWVLLVKRCGRNWISMKALIDMSKHKYLIRNSFSER